MTKLMIKNKESSNRVQRGYKMFKSHKGWLIAPLAALGLTLCGGLNIVHADHIVSNNAENQQNSVSPSMDNSDANISENDMSVGDSDNIGNNTNQSSVSANSNSNSNVVTNWQTNPVNLENLANVDVQYQDIPGKRVAPTQELNTTVGRTATINPNGTVQVGNRQTKIPKGYMVVKSPVSQEKLQRGFNPAIIDVQKSTNVLQDFTHSLSNQAGVRHPMSLMALGMDHKAQNNRKLSLGDPSPSDAPDNTGSYAGKSLSSQGKSQTDSSANSSTGVKPFNWPAKMAFHPDPRDPSIYYIDGDEYHQRIRSVKAYPVKDPKGHIIAFCRDPSEDTPRGSVESKAGNPSALAWNIAVAGFPYYTGADTAKTEGAVQDAIWSWSTGSTSHLNSSSLAHKIYSEAKKQGSKKMAPPNNAPGFTVQRYDVSGVQSVLAIAWGSGSSSSTSGSGGGGGGCGGGAAAAGAAGGGAAAAAAAGGGAAGGGAAAAGAGGATNGTAGGVVGGGNGNNNSTPTGPNNNDVIPAGAVTTSNNNPSNNNIVPEVPMVNNNDVTNNYPQKVDDHVGVLTALAALVGQESKSENLELANLQDKSMNYDLGRGQTRDNWIQNIQVNMAQRDGSLAAKINSAAATASNGSAIQSFAYSAGMQSMQNSLKNSQELQSVKDRLASAQANQSANQTNTSTDTDNDNNEMTENSGTTQGNDDFNQDLQNDFQQIPDQNANGNQTQSNDQAQPTPVQNLSNNGSGPSSFNPGSNILSQLNQALEGITGGNNSQNNDNGDGSNVMSQLNNLLNGITS